MKCARKTTVLILLLVCVSKCSSMSDKELEDFSNFLVSTSQLDQNLKKGTEGEFDEEEPASDHAWEESGKFEGDLILNDRQRKLIVEDVAEGLSRNGLKDSTKRWPDNEVIYYIQQEHFSADQVQAIQNGIDDLAQASCIKFRPYRKGDRDAVVIQGSRRGCFSQVGYQSGYQVLNLSGRHPVGRGCFRHGTVVHELLHTLGFYHMQSSPDRDDHVDVIWENILQPARHNFRKYNTFAVTDFGVGYDYDSVLHYSRRAFSRNGQDTIVPKKSGADIGQRVGLSDKDTQKLNKMYCDADSGSFDANEEDTTKKPVTKKKKKKPKNQPFQGHGIGYHQGKTVVIKLPTVETHMLPDLPSYHVFDYFSKAPQALSPALIEGFGIGKELTYSRESSLSDNINKPNVLNAPLEDAHTNELETKPYTDQSNRFKSFIQSKENETENIENDSIENGKGKIVLNDDKTEVFDRLEKIIKTHVYPSQSPDLNLYKPNEDFHNYGNIASDRRREYSKENLSLINSKHPNNSEPLNQKVGIFEIDITKNTKDNIKNEHDINYYLPTDTSKQDSYSSNPKNMYEDTHNISFDYSPNWYKQIFLENNSHDQDIINGKPLHGDINGEIQSTVLQENITNEPEKQSEISYANSKKIQSEKETDLTRSPLDKPVDLSNPEKENQKAYSGLNIFEQRLASILNDYTKFDTYDITPPYYNYYSSKEADDKFRSLKYTHPKEDTFADIKINY